ncbi:hypothetical protein [Streptomyces sp. NBC_01187]|uniref:hypothetical protein n=1 Tax=Streptomyces sp. NBC_01187 TaxID=2903766 RepID=UPI00386A1E81|nr:hypothetical protein OG220_23295 [Streptomyces sp. NBC_01187]
MQKTRIAAAAAGVVLTAGLTACGGSDSGGDGGSGGGGSKAGGSPLQGTLVELRKASTATEKQQSAKVDGVQKQTTPQGDMSSDLKGVMDWSEGGVTGDIEVTQSGSATKGSPMGNKPMTVRYAKDAMYVNMGDEFASTAGKGKHWIKYDYDVLAEKAGASGAFMKDQLQNNNPARSVQLLLASKKVKQVGSEQVRGKKATHYSGTVKVSELAKMQSKDLSEKELQQLQQQLEQTGMTTEKIDLWVDDQDLLVKKWETAKSTKGQGDLDSTVYYSDYGTEVNVEDPSSSDAMDFTELTGGQS